MKYGFRKEVKNMSERERIERFLESIEDDVRYF